MNVVILMVMTSVLSFTAVLLTKYKLDISQCSPKKPDSLWWFIMPVFVFMLGGFLAYKVAVNTITIFMAVELCLTYIFLVSAAIFDIKLRLIPNFIPLAIITARFIIFGLEYALGYDALPYFLNGIIAGVGCFIVLYIAHKLSKGGIGGGDIKLAVAIGFMCGFQAMLTTLTISFLICSLMLIPLFIFKKCTLHSSLPFGPFIYVSFAIVLAVSLY